MMTIVSYSLIQSTLEYDREIYNTIKYILLIADFLFIAYIALWLASKKLSPELNLTKKVSVLMKSNQILLFPLVIFMRFKITNLLQ